MAEAADVEEMDEAGVVSRPVESLEYENVFVCRVGRSEADDVSTAEMEEADGVNGCGAVNGPVS